MEKGWGSSGVKTQLLTIPFRLGLWKKVVLLKDHDALMLSMKESRQQDSQSIDLPAPILRLASLRMLLGLTISSSKITQVFPW